MYIIKDLETNKYYKSGCKPNQGWIDELDQAKEYPDYPRANAALGMVRKYQPTPLNNFKVVLKTNEYPSNVDDKLNSITQEIETLNKVLNQHVSRIIKLEEEIKKEYSERIYGIGSLIKRIETLEKKFNLKNKTEQRILDNLSKNNSIDWMNK